MAKVPKRLGHGEGGGRVPNLEELLNDIATDLESLIDGFNALLAKLDNDTGVDDTDYESELEIAERNHQASDE